MAATITMESVNQLEAATGVNQMAMTVVDQPAPGTVELAAATMNPIAIVTEISNYTTTGETTTIPLADALIQSAATVPTDALSTTAPANALASTTAPADSHTLALADAPQAATTAPADSHTLALVDAPQAATTAPADSLAPADAPSALVPVGSGTGKKTGIMRPNPNSTTAR